MELIEKMARAIMDHRSPMQPGLQWNIESDENRDWYRGLAQAALTALIEHTGGDGVTEGDREVWREAVFDYGGLSIPGEGEDSATQVVARHRALAAAAERARIVAWLREQDGYGEWQEVADAIERGEV